MSTIVKSIVKRFVPPILLLCDMPNFPSQLFIHSFKNQTFSLHPKFPPQFFNPPHSFSLSVSLHASYLAQIHSLKCLKIESYISSNSIQSNGFPLIQTNLRVIISPYKYQTLQPNFTSQIAIYLSTKEILHFMARELKACRFLVLFLFIGFVLVFSTIQARNLHTPNHHHHHHARMKPVSPSQAGTDHYFVEVLNLWGIKTSGPSDPDGH